MNSRVRLVSAALVLMALAAPALPASPNAEALQVIAHDLKQLRVASKVSAVLWTRRNGYFTLQVVLPLRRQSVVGTRTVAMAPARRETVSNVQVWVLRADGSAIPAQSVAHPDTGKIGLRTQALEARYSYSFAAGQQAVAIAMQVDDTFVIEQLKPL